MYSSEKMFIMKFIACLKKIGVEDFPYDDDDRFDKGAECMLGYFQDNRERLGKYTNELAMLFLKNPLNGKFFEFREGIEHQNGGLLAFDNPHYKKATIKLDKPGVKYILDQNNLDISSEHLFEFSKAFCKGATVYHPEC